MAKKSGIDSLVRELVQKEVERVTKAALSAAPAKKAQREPDWTKVTHTCPGCGNTGYVDPMFGTRTDRGKKYKMSYCITCRGLSKYYGGVRKDQRLRDNRKKP